VTDSVDVAARPADRTDIDTIIELYQASRTAVADQRGGELDNILTLHSEAGQWPGRYTSLLEDSDSSLVVGEVDGLVMGYTLAKIIELDGNERLMRVGELFVVPDARGVGVGRALLQFVVDEAEHRGCRGIDARALPGDRSTKNFFEASGFAARSIVMHNGQG